MSRIFPQCNFIWDSQWDLLNIINLLALSYWEFHSGIASNIHNLILLLILRWYPIIISCPCIFSFITNLCCRDSNGKIWVQMTFACLYCEGVLILSPCRENWSFLKLVEHCYLWPFFIPFLSDSCSRGGSSLLHISCVWLPVVYPSGSVYRWVECSGRRSRINGWSPSWRHSLSLYCSLSPSR